MLGFWGLGFRVVGHRFVTGEPGTMGVSPAYIVRAEVT